MHTVLVIDDEKPIRAYIVKVLQGAGYRVYESDNGMDALMLIRSIRPQLILCDVVMPGVSGFSVLEMLRGDSTISHIPFVFLTAKSDPSFMEYGLELGSDYYLTKPVLKEDLLSTVAARLASLDAALSCTDGMLEAMSGINRAGWLYFNVAQRQLEETYHGWYVAIEENSGRCFLGRTAEEAHTAASQIVNGSPLYLRQLGAN